MHLRSYMGVTLFPGVTYRFPDGAVFVVSA